MGYYTGLIIYIFVLYLVTNQFKYKEKGRKIFFIMSGIGIILFQGYRSFNVGTDLPIYIASYSRIGFLDFLNYEYLNFEVGYVFLNKILYNLGLNEREFLIVIALIIQIPILFTIYKYSKMPLISILWYFSFGNFMFTFSGIRQSIAMAICFFGFKFIKEKKVKWFIVIIIIASGFHTSALFCLLLYPVYYLNINRKKMIFAFGILFLVFVFRQQIFSILSRMYYGEASGTSSTGAYTMFVVYVGIFSISFINKKKDGYLEYRGLRNILLLLAMIYSFASIHDFITRIGYPLSLYMSLYIPELILGFNVKPKTLYYGICHLGLLIAFYYFLGGLNTLPFSFG